MVGNAGRWGNAARVDSAAMRAVLLDVDGVLQVSGRALPGAPEAVAALREAGHPVRFVTNNTVRARAVLAADLRALGFALDDAELETVPLAAARALAGMRVLPLTVRAIHDDLAESLELVDSGADVVLVGGADESDETRETFAWDRLEIAFAELERGARLVALHRNRWWQTASGPCVDSALVVAGLEEVSGVRAELVGKPSPTLLRAALESVGGSDGATMVGDDVEADIGAAKAIGVEAVLVRTGKFREDTLAAADPQPDAVLDSIAAVPDFVAGR